MEVSGTIVAPSGLLKVRAHGFCAGRQVRIGLEPAARVRRTQRSLPGRIKLSTARVDRNRNVSSSVAIPKGVGPGAYALVVNGRSRNCSSVKVVRSRITVAGVQASKPAGGREGSPNGDAGERLPFTGLALTLLTGVGVALLFAGLLLRRRVARRPA